MKTWEYHRDGFTISTNNARIDIASIHEYLSQHSYWAQGRSVEVVQRSINNSLCFGVYQGNWQVGFARTVTDYATFAWLCDVFIFEPYRGLGLAKWLVETIVHHPHLQGLTLFLLATRDAHTLYARYGGFQPLPVTEKWMARPRTE